MTIEIPTRPPDHTDVWEKEKMNLSWRFCTSFWFEEMVCCYEWPVRNPVVSQLAVTSKGQLYATDTTEVTMVFSQSVQNAYDSWLLEKEIWK